MVTISSRTSAICAIAAVFTLCATACSDDPVTVASVYLDCPTGWQPNSTGEVCAPICSEGTLLNDNETGCVPTAPTSIAVPAADTTGGASEDVSTPPPPTPDTSTGPESPYIDCPTGWQPNSTGEGCAPVCATGTELNADEDGCVPISDDPVDPPNTEDATTPPVDPPDVDPGPTEDTGTEPEPAPVDCPAGYQEADIDGVTVCVPATNITVHGYVLDSASGQGVVGALVTANALSDAPLVTDDTGYFEIAGVTQVGNIAIYYAAEGYHSSYAWVGIESASDYGSGEVFIEATASLVAVDEESVEVEPASDGWISGTVYAGDQPATGAVVRLRYTTTGVEAGSAITDADGAFMISEIAAGGHAFDLLVDNYDADGDGGYDYQGLTLNVGAINEGGSSSVNASNIVLVLEAIGKSLSYANFTPPLTDVSGPGLNANLQFASAGANLIFHFGSETQTDTLVVSLVERIGGAISKYVGISASWNESGTVLTLNPNALLTQDADPATDYELRIEALLWSDGSAFVSTGAGVAGAARFQFQVGEAPSYLTTPVPTIYTDNLGTDTQDVALVSCDARACWLLDAQGYPIDGFVFPAEEVDPSAFINGEDGFQLTWSPVAGATDYKVYARQTYDGPEADGLQGWLPIQLGSLVMGLYSEGAPTTVFVTGVLATGSPSWLDFGAVGPTNVGNTLAFGNMIQLAVTVVDELGVESPIDENKTLTLMDVTKPGIRKVEHSNSEVTKDATGTFDNILSFAVQFTELIEPGATGNWSVTSNRIGSMTQPAQVIWGNPDVFSGDNVDDGAVFQDIQLDMRWPCAIVTEDADDSATKLYLNDVSIFPTGLGIEVLFLDADDATNLAHPGIRNVYQSDPATGEIEFFNPLGSDGGPGLSKGDFVCTVLPQGGLSTGGGVMFTDDTEPQINTDDVSLFHVGQHVLVVSKQLNEGATANALVYETVVTGMFPALYPPGSDIPIQLGRLYFADPPPENYSNTVVFPKPSHSASFRKVTEMRLLADVVTGATDPSVSTLDVTQSSFEGSLAMVGDLVVVDADGDLDTLTDQYWATIAQMSTFRDNPDTGDVDETDYQVTFSPSGGGANAFPSVLDLDADTTRILCLGESFKLTGLEDTSSNVGMHTLLDQFSFCDGGLAECTLQGIFRY
jgi:hypothetical protein